MTGVRVQPKRFYDGGLPAHDGQPGVPPDPERDPRIVLDRQHDNGRESFRLARRIAYADRHLGEILVPADPATFRSDLTSVPWLFTWLVPKTGAHLPAALLHDGLVAGNDGPTYISTDGHVIDRVEADRVFRDAMADTGTWVVRRWLVWSAVATATIFFGSASWSRATCWRYRIAAGGTIALIIYLGACATVDLADGSVPGLVGLPWMGERSTPLELVGGAAGAIAIPFLAGLTWGRFRVAGTTAGVLVALLLHVSVVLLALTALYRLVEWAVATAPRVVGAVTVVAVGASFALVALAFLGS